MSFGAADWLWALAFLPLLVFLFVRGERRSAARLKEFVAPRLLPTLGATVNRFRRTLRFALVLLGLGLAILALSKPRYGYTYEEVKRKGLDLVIAVDTSRSMLANDVPPNRLQRVKLAAQDLVNELRGDRVGLIAFAGRAFLQAPLTIDYQAAVEALNELDTEIIPEGGTNISEAIKLAVNTFGKSAIGNRALIIFTDGEELAGDAAKVAQEAADAGVKIFTVGVGTPEGSLIPLNARDGQTAFVKDPSGQVVKSKLDETRLRELAERTGGFFLRLAGGPSTMSKLYDDGLSKMQAGEIDTKMSRQPIERYQWPLGAALLALATSLLVGERKRSRSPVAAVYDRRNGAKAQVGANGGRRPPLQTTRAAIIALVGLSPLSAHAAAPGLDAYRQGDYAKAYEQFQRTLQEHPEARAADKIQFDAGAAAYKMKDYGKALQAFSQALLSKNQSLQSRSHYNLGNTLYQRGETQKAPPEKLQDWTNALQHYDQTLKLDPENKEAKENREFVEKKIEELKKEQEQQQQPTPTPSPSPDQQKKQDQKQDQQQQQQQDQQQQQQDQSSQDQQKQDQSGEQQQPQEQGSTPTPSPEPGASPSPSPSDSPGSGATPTPSPGETAPSPSPGQDGDQSSPSPSPGEGEGQEGDGPSPSPGPSASPSPKLEGEVRGAEGEQPPPEQQQAQALEEAEQPPEGEMSEQQALRLLEAMKDEEARVQLDERRKARRVYKDW